MRLVRDREDARWMPSRFHFALFRLAAFLRLRGMAPRPRQGIILVIDRDQSAFENHAVSIWIAVTLACYIAAELPWLFPLAILAGLLLALTAMQFLVVIGGLIVRSTRANSIFLMSLFFLAAAYYARAASWVRFVAWHVLALAALNAVAAVIVFALRGAIAKREAAFAA
jgi:hypothetical protein